MSQAVEELEALLQDQPANPLRPNQVKEYQDELGRLGAMAVGKDMEGHATAWVPGDRAAAGRRIRQIRETLAAQAPKKITGDRADAVHRKTQEVLETVIKPGLLPRSHLRRNPPGAVGHLLRIEFARPFKTAVLTVKRALRALDPDNEDPDYTNIERFRPEGMGDGTSSFMADAQIPGVHAMSDRAKRNWPLGKPTVDTPQAQAQRRDSSQGAARRRAAPKPKRDLSEKQKAALEKGRAAAAAKRAASTATTECVAATGYVGVRVPEAAG